jgi:hypothetical protein
MQLLISHPFWDNFSKALSISVSKKSKNNLSLLPGVQIRK